MLFSLFFKFKVKTFCAYYWVLILHFVQYSVALLHNFHFYLILLFIFLYHYGFPPQIIIIIISIKLLRLYFALYTMLQFKYNFIF